MRYFDCGILCNKGTGTVGLYLWCLGDICVFGWYLCCIFAVLGSNGVVFVWYLGGICVFR